MDERRDARRAGEQEDAPAGERGAAQAGERDARPAGVRDAEVEADGRALASVVRLRILRLCLDDALTNKEIAARLGKDPATTFHHVQVLAERGFLAAQPERRGTRGAREVPYLATRKSWRTPIPEGQNRVLVEAFLEELAEADPRTVLTARLGLRLSAEHHAELLTRVNALLEEYAALPPDPDGRPWSVFVALHEDVSRLPAAVRDGGSTVGAPAEPPGGRVPPRRAPTRPSRRPPAEHLPRG